MEMKRCTMCGNEYPATTEYFGKQKRVKSGLKSRCKKCEKVLKSNWDKNNKEKIVAYGKQYRKCNKEKIKKYQKEYDKKYNQINKKKIRKKNVEYNRKNKERKKEYNKKYYENNKERIKQSVTNYYIKIDCWKGKLRRRKYYLQNRESLLIKSRKHKKIYRKNNPEKFRIDCIKRRTLKKNSIATMTTQDWRECLEFFNYKDAYTGLPMEKVSQDHVIPLSKGGAYTKQNIVPCDVKTNSSKNNNDMEEWFKKQPFFNENRLNKIYKWIGISNDNQQLKFI